MVADDGPAGGVEVKVCPLSIECRAGHGPWHGGFLPAHSTSSYPIGRAGRNILRWPVAMGDEGCEVGAERSRGDCAMRRQALVGCYDARRCGGDVGAVRASVNGPLTCIAVNSRCACCAHELHVKSWFS